MADVFLIRHGQCLSNADRRLCFDTDEADCLTQLGRWQSLQAAIALKAVWKGGMLLLSSPICRARETTEIIARELGVDGGIVFDERLVEKMPNETFEEAADRVWQFIEEYDARSDGLVCVTHGHVLQALAVRTLGLKDPMELLPLNCGISHFRQGCLMSLNHGEHLAGLELDL